MKEKKMLKESSKIVLTYIALFILCLLFVLWIGFMYYLQYKRERVEFKSRYTFTIDVELDGDVIDKDSNTFDSDNVGLLNLNLSKVSEKWIEQYLDQFVGIYVPRSKAIKEYTVNSARVLDNSTNTVLLYFTVVPYNTESDFFDSWEGIMDDGKLKCEWVVTYNINDNFNNSASVYVKSIMSSEAYGIIQYYASQQNSGVDNINEKTINPNVDELADYHIRENSLQVTYDGGTRYVTVPVATTKLLFEDNSTSTLKEGSFMITTEKTAFVYGGMTVNNTRVPVTVVYSDDKGANWTTCELDNVYTADYYYVHFFNEEDGVVVCGYGRSNETNESSRIYTTSNGGETWKTVGSGPTTNLIKGVIFITKDVGFFCYDYAEGMDSNLYKTEDGGKTFSKVILEQQELDSSASKNDKQQLQTWSDVYKETLVPVITSTGSITVYLTQGKSGSYNDGKTAAKYQSSDEGKTWKYIGQMEIK